MRVKSVVWGLVAAVVLVGALVAMQREPRAAEPSFQPASRAAAPEGAEGPESAESNAEQTEAAQPDVNAEPEARPPLEMADLDVPGADEAESEPRRSAGDCEHPLLPSTPGEWRRYAWRQSTEAEAAVLRIEALRARDAVQGEREITWRVEITASDDAVLAREEMTTRCAPGQAAEEPWFGILERSLGLQVTGEPRWRWPARLRMGARFEGVATFDTRGADMRPPEGVDGPVNLRVMRKHVVGAREAVEVPAGRWRAWRVDYEEEHAFGERGERGTGTVWIAPSIGLVQSTAENSRGVRQTIELVAFGQ